MVDDADQLKKHPSVLQMYMGRIRLSRNGKELEGVCPLHADKNPSFKLRQAEDGTYLWNCFGCDPKGGNIFQFLQKLDSISFNQAVQKVREHVGQSWGGKKEVVEQTFRPLADTASKELKKFTLEEYAKLEDALANNQEAQAWLQNNRGIGMATAKRLHLGYRHDLGRIAGDFERKGWIAHPIIEKNEIIGLEYRSIVDKQFRKQPGMRLGLFNISTIDMLEPVFLTEGVYDTASFEQGQFHSVSIPNAQYTLSASDKDLLLSAECVILAGDNDDAGKKIMSKLFREMKERTYWLHWPEGIKDANEFFLKTCGRSESVFRTKINELVAAAKSKPMEGVYDVRQSLLTSTHTGSVDDPSRLRFPWPTVDDMALISPGTVTTFYSTDSGMGKSTLVLQATLHGAMKHGEIVLNYQAEMTPQQIDTIIASHLLRKDRLTLTEEDYRAAGRLLPADVKYYIGRNTSFTTMTEVLDLLEHAVRRFGATVCVLDNLHFLSRNEQDPVKAQANAMQRITNMAGEYGLKFLLVHQARKADQNHKRKVTHVSDLDGSKAVQNDSSFIFSIHREEIKHARDGEDLGGHEYDPITEIRLQKIREKGPGKSYTQLMFVGNMSTFTEVARIEEPELFGGAR